MQVQAVDRIIYDKKRYKRDVLIGPVLCLQEDAGLDRTMGAYGILKNEFYSTCSHVQFYKEKNNEEAK